MVSEVAQVAVAAHKGNTKVDTNLIDAAITNGAKAIILDPANADGSVGVVKKTTDAGIPVLVVNAEINESGGAIAQPVSNNAQCAALGAVTWAELVGDQGIFVAFSGNDDMALGAIAALKDVGNLDGVIVGRFDGSPDAVDAVKAGEMACAMLRPAAAFSAEAVRQVDDDIKNGEPMMADEKQVFDCLLKRPSTSAPRPVRSEPISRDTADLRGRAATPPGRPHLRLIPASCRGLALAPVTRRGPVLPNHSLAPRPLQAPRRAVEARRQAAVISSCMPINRRQALVRGGGRGADVGRPRQVRGRNRPRHGPRSEAGAAVPRLSRRSARGSRPPSAPPGPRHLWPRR